LGHFIANAYFLKFSFFNPDCLNIEKNVPMGISFLGSGTMTV